MKSGKVSDTVLRRSILKEVQKVNHGTAQPFVGGGAGVLPLSCVCGGLARANEQTETSVFSAMQTVSGEGLQTAYLAAVRAANSLAAKGAVPQYASVAITIPESMEEHDLRKLHEAYGAFLQSRNITVIGGHTAVSAVVTAPVVSAQMFGAQSTTDTLNSAPKNTPADYCGLDIVMTKYCGLGGTALLASHFAEELTTRYPKRFIERGVELLFITPKNAEAYLALENGAAYVHAAAEGGVFGALWELAEYAQCGLKIDLPSIPILQETVEICEYFDINPYQLRTEGVFLILTKHGNRLCELLAEQDVPAAVIGKTTSDADRILQNGEEQRYLEPNRVEEYERVMTDKR